VRKAAVHFFRVHARLQADIAGDHKPGLRSLDEAIRRRFHLVPFTVTIPPAERDQWLSHKPFGRCRSLRLVLPAYDFFDRAIAR
jgi:hypothetical protein